MGTRPEILRRGAAMAVILLLCAAGPAFAQDDASAAMLRRWVQAVRDHEPGTADAAARFAASLTYADRRVLHPAMQLFLRGMHAAPGQARARPLVDIVALVMSVRQKEGVSPFLRRAAVLHSDAVVFHDEFPEPPDDAPKAAPRPGRSSQLVLPGLLFYGRSVQHLDGQVVAETLAVWHWVFARSLLDELLSSVQAVSDADRAFVSNWYHGAAALLFATSRHGDLNLHLEHASRVLPGDARMLFDRGCFAEMQGLAIYQALSDDPSNRPALGRLTISVPTAASTDATAERLFRRALDVEPGYAEARVHLARLVDRRGRHDEAAAEIAQALAQRLDRRTSFYARLFAGRIALARNRPDDALGHYSAAADLYPNAQSALLGASHAAMIASNVPAALSFVQRLSPRAGESDPDPWWLYRVGPGLDVGTLMRVIWSAAR